LLGLVVAALFFSLIGIFPPPPHPQHIQHVLPNDRFQKPG
jgi:hypothetical protein